MDRYILVAVDGSISSRRAVEVAGMIGRTYGPPLAAVRLVHVVPMGYLGRHVANVDFRALQVQHSAALQELRTKYVEDAIGPFLFESEDALRRSGITAPIERIVADGDPADEIIRLSRQEDTLIVVGRRGMTQADNAAIGGVTKRVLNAALCDVVVVPSAYAEGRTHFTKILVPTDGSPHSEAAVSRAVSLARTDGAHIVAFSVAQISGISREDISVAGIDYASLVRAMRSVAEKNVAKVRDYAVAQGCEAETSVVDGVPYEEIVKAADSGQADLVVMGSHGMSALERFFLGSVTERVIAATSCAVYVTKTPQT